MNKERFNNYKATDFDSIGEEPAPAAETAAEAPASAAEASSEGTKAESVMSRGEARFQKVGETLNSLKSNMRNFFAKIPQVAGAWSKKAGEAIGNISRGAAVGILSTPELVGAGIERAQEAGAAMGSAAMETATAGSKAFLGGVDAVGNKIQGGLDAAADFVLDTPEKVAAFGREKGEQFTSFVAEKAEAARNVAELAGNYTSEKAAQARAGIEGGIRNVTGWGERSLAFAEAKRQEAMQNFRSKLDQARVARLEREHQVAVDKLAEIRNKLGLRDEVAGYGFKMAA